MMSLSRVTHLDVSQRAPKSASDEHDVEREPLRSRKTSSCSMYCVEEVLALARRARLADRAAADALRSRLAALESSQALAVARAFAHRLALANIAEQHHRIRVRRIAANFAFFRSLLDLLAMVLSKADPEIAAYYDRMLIPDQLRPLGHELRAHHPLVTINGTAAGMRNTG